MITQEAAQYWKACSAGSPKTSLAQVDELLLAAEKIPQRVTKGDAQALMAEVLGNEKLLGTKLIAAVRERLLKWAQDYSPAAPTLGRPDLSPLAVQVAIMVRSLSGEDRQPYRDLLVAMMGRNFQLEDLMSLVLKHNLPNLIDWKPETAVQALEIVNQLPAADPVPVFSGVQHGACRRCGVQVGEEDFCDACTKADDEPPAAEEVAAVAASQEFNPQILLNRPWRHRDGAAAKVTAIQGFGEAAVLEVTIVDDPTLPPQQWAVHRFLEEFMEDVAHPNQLTLIPPVQEEPPCPTAPDATTEPPSPSPAAAPATSETGLSSSPEASTTEPQATAPSASVASDIDPVPPSLSPATSAAPAPTPLTFPTPEGLAGLRQEEAILIQQIADRQTRLDQVRAAITEEERTGEKRRKREELLAQLAALNAELGETA